jgi:hypothetical protein
VFDDGLFEIICLDIAQRIMCDTGKRQIGVGPR